MGVAGYAYYENIERADPKCAPPFLVGLHPALKQCT